MEFQEVVQRRRIVRHFAPRHHFVGMYDDTDEAVVRRQAELEHGGSDPAGRTAETVELTNRLVPYFESTGDGATRVPPQASLPAAVEQNANAETNADANAIRRLRYGYRLDRVEPRLDARESDAAASRAGGAQSASISSVPHGISLSH